MRGLRLNLDSSTELELDFSLKTLFDREIPKACPVATDSVVEVFMAEGEYNIVAPGPSVMEGELAKFIVPECRLSLPLKVWNELTAKLPQSLRH